MVTGGAGFIGSHVVDELINEGHQVTVYDNLQTGYEEYINKKADFIKADLEDINRIKKELSGFDATIHLASECIIKDSIDDPETHLKRNINNAINLLEAMRVNNVKKIVFSSSAAVYGETGDNPVDEEFPKRPMQPYGASKLTIEYILSGYYHSFGINSTSLRYFNVYGPRDDQIPVSRAVPKWFKAVLNNKEIELNWAGKQLRDYIFVEDVARAHIIALKNCDGCKAYNIGSNTGTTMIQVLEAIFNATGKRIHIIDAGPRPGDPNKLVANTTKIKRELGWEPRFSLEQGMKKTYDFYLNHPESLKRI
jgi:UDP-glucose 4-epimerase